MQSTFVLFLQGQDVVKSQMSSCHSYKIWHFLKPYLMFPTKNLKELNCSNMILFGLVFAILLPYNYLANSTLTSNKNIDNVMLLGMARETTQKYMNKGMALVQAFMNSQNVLFANFMGHV